MSVMVWTVLIESHTRWQVLRRDGRRCVVSGQRDTWFEDDTPADALPGLVDAVRIFKHPLVVYKEIYDADEVCAVNTGRSFKGMKANCTSTAGWIDYGSRQP